MPNDDKYTVQYDQPGLELAPQNPFLPEKSNHDNALVAELPRSQADGQHYQYSQQQSYGYQHHAKLQSISLSEAPAHVPEHDQGIESLFPTKGHKPGRRYCGLRKPIFITLFALLCLILIGVGVGVGAGIAVSNNSKKSTSGGDALSAGSASSSSGSSQPSNTASSAGSAASAASSSPSSLVRAGSDIQKSSASVSGAGTSIFLQTFTQDMSSGAITYRLYLAPSTSWQTLQTLDLAVPPLIGTSITITNQFDTSTNNTFVNVFYLTGNSTNANIALANMTCTTDSPVCKTTFNDIVANTTKYPVHPSSSLAATWLAPAGHPPSWRIYYTNSDQYICELAGLNTWSSQVIGGKAGLGASIAVLNNPPTGLNVYYMDDSNLLQTVVYKGDWSSPTKLSLAGTINATTPLAAVYVPDVFIYQIFYVSTDGAIHSYAKVNATGAWAAQSSKVWTAVDTGTGIAATAWGDQMRLFYDDGGRLNQAAAAAPAVANTAETWKVSAIG